MDGGVGLDLGGKEGHTLEGKGGVEHESHPLHEGRLLGNQAHFAE